ncbi:hypothetical protein [Rhodococcus sp. NPDC059234]|uniref:hypothetical protein n=1 Tax=Rhodococcus sp. NPDC059234 TaxID=3346781 RepID=UPI0036703C98
MGLPHVEVAPAIDSTSYGGVMLGLAIGLAGAAAAIGLGLLGAGVGILLSDASAKHHIRPLER